jgi:hypothetical protein
MNRGWKLVGVAVLAAGMTAAVVVLVQQLRERKALVDDTVDDVEAQINALDPATRAAVVARLSVDEARKVRAYVSD